MKFGLFIPQGWRQDLARHRPRPALGGHGGAGAARRRQRGLVLDLGLRPLPHRARGPPRRPPTRRGPSWPPSRASPAGSAWARCARAWATATPPTSPRSPRRSTSSREGRLEMGIGAGWYEHEWRAYGYGFPSRRRAPRRCSREGIEIMRQMWTTGRATYAGKHYSVDGALCFPRPLQGDSVAGEPAQRHPPVGGRWRGTQDAADRGGVRRLHQLLAAPEEFTPRARSCAGTARTSAATSTRSCAAPTTTSSSVETRPRCSERMGWIRDHYTRQGCRQDAVESRGEVCSRRARSSAPPSRSSRRCVDLEARGMTYAITYFVEQAYDLVGVELFEREVVPCAHQPRTAQQPLALPPRPVGLGAACRVPVGRLGCAETGEPDGWDAAEATPPCPPPPCLPDFVCGDASTRRQNGGSTAI